MEVSSSLFFLCASFFSLSLSRRTARGHGILIYLSQFYASSLLFLLPLSP